MPDTDAGWSQARVHLQAVLEFLHGPPKTRRAGASRHFLAHGAGWRPRALLKEQSAIGGVADAAGMGVGICRKFLESFIRQ